MVVCWIPYNLVGVDHLVLARFWKGSFYFVLDILTHDVVIQLEWETAGECEKGIAGS